MSDELTAAVARNEKGELDKAHLGDGRDGQDRRVRHWWLIKLFVTPGDP